jgi:epoxyqueuosine reductase
MHATQIIEYATSLGFDLLGFAPLTDGDAPSYAAFVNWLSNGRHGEMAYLAREPERRRDPRVLLSGAHSIVIVAVSYDTLAVPSDILNDPSRGRIARYAWGADYHDVLTPRLRQLGEWISHTSRAYVDTGAILERAWAERAGLGFVGKNTCLIHRERGSYLFLGAVLVGEGITDIPASAIHKKAQCGCGNCTRCLVACPTQALVAPYQLDARRCISYLTIEQKGAIPTELRALMGNWIFGCDVCQDVCPYVRRYSAPTAERAFYPFDVNRAAPRLLDVLNWTRDEFNMRYKDAPLKRAKWRGIMRNACVAAGNWGDASALPALRMLAECDEPLVRDHAQWAVRRIADSR